MGFCFCYKTFRFSWLFFVYSFVFCEPKFVCVYMCVCVFAFLKVQPRWVLSQVVACQAINQSTAKSHQRLSDLSCCCCRRCWCCCLRPADFDAFVSVLYFFSIIFFAQLFSSFDCLMVDDIRQALQLLPLLPTAELDVSETAMTIYHVKFVFQFLFFVSFFLSFSPFLLRVQSIFSFFFNFIFMFSLLLLKSF